MGCLPFAFSLLLAPLSAGGGTVTCKLLDNAAASGRTFPACINRNRHVEAGASRCARICCFTDSAVMRLGFSMLRMISGFDVEKRTTRSRGVSVMVTSRAARKQPWTTCRRAGQTRSSSAKVYCNSFSRAVSSPVPSLLNPSHRPSIIFVCISNTTLLAYNSRERKRPS